MQKLLFFFSHRLLAIARWDIHFLFLRLKNFLTFQSRRIQRFLGTRKHPLLLNLGSGPRGIVDEHWLNVDGFQDRNVHFLLDFNRRLPFPDGTFAGVFCEHVLEHFSYAHGQALMREVHRVLADGGVVRLIVPDAELITRAYIERPADLIAHRNQADATAMEIVNSYFRQRYEHQFLYDWQTMEKMLRGAGFSEVVRANAAQPVLLPDLVLDDEKYFWESLYVEARR